MKFSDFTKAVSKLEETNSRLEIIKILSEIFKMLPPDEISYACYLLQGGLAPSYKGVVFQLAEKMVSRVIASAYDVSVREVDERYIKLGDYSLVVSEFARRRSSNLSISEVYASLTRVASLEGEGSQEAKVLALASVLTSLDAYSASFVVRVALGRLRLGFSDKSMIVALSAMEGGESKKALLNKAYEVLPDVGLLAQRVKVDGIDKACRNISPVVLVPVLPMLAQRIKTPEEMIKKMGKVSVEPKFDGLRVLIHFDRKSKKIAAFTRNLKDISHIFPELLDIFKYSNCDSLILDSEAIGLSAETKKFVEFSGTMQRRRKHDIDAISKKIPIQFQVFDVLSIDGKSYMNKSYVERREALSGVFVKNDTFKVDDYFLTDSPDEVLRLHAKYRGQGLEGVIVKRSDSEYVPGRTGWRWVKMKEDPSSVAKLSDTLDCVIIGYTPGKGKRVGFGIGQFLVGVLDGEDIKTITKVGTGLTDSDFQELNKRLSVIRVSEKPREYFVSKLHKPHFWVLPEVVVEIAADDITKSPTHTSGYALRFPRLVRFRDDKDYKQATSVSEVFDMFSNQFDV